MKRLSMPPTPAATAAGPVLSVFSSSKKDDDYEPKYVLVPDAASAPPRTRSFAMQSVARGLRNKSIQVRLPFPYQFTTVAATAYNSSFALDLTSVAEFSADLINLYDEVKIDGFDIHLCFLPFGYTTSSASHVCGIAFDPVNSGAAGSVTNVAQHGQHLLLALEPGGSAVPQCTSRNGLIHWHITPPSGVMRSTAIVAVHGKDEYVSCSDANIIFGYLKPYIPSLGATGVVYLDSMIFFNLTFRCRT